MKPYKFVQMVMSNIKRFGYSLIVIGLIGTGITVAGILNTHDMAQQEAATSFAERISQNLWPASVSFPLLIVGLVLLIIGWLRNRNISHPNIKRVNFNG